MAGETRSDDFDTSSLDGSWRIEGPAGTASLGVSATDAYLQIAVPAGGDYDAWGANTTKRVMQDAADADLTVSAGFLTMPTATQRYQMQGLLFEADANDYIRFDVHSAGSKLYAFAGVTTNGVSSNRIRRSIDADDADHLRVTRTGDTWRFEASGDGESWSVLGSFTYDLALTAAGVFAGSTDDDLAGPGYVARIDYFEVASDPILDEDASVGGDPVPTANDDAFTTAADTALVLTVASDLLGNDTDDDPLTVTGYGTPQFGTLTPSADGSTVTYTPNPGHSGPDSFSYTVSDGSHSDTATVTVTTEGAGGGEPAPTANDDAFTTAADTALVLTVASDLLGNDTDDDPLTVTGYGTPQFGTLTPSADGSTVTYTPNPGHSGPDSFSYTVSDGTHSDTATVTVTTEDDTPPPSQSLASDDFDTSGLDGSWRIEGPAGTASLGVSATDAYLQIAVPAGGDYDAWGANTTKRVMQDAADADLTVSAGFLTMPTATQRYQMQGLLFEADANDYIRFDVHSAGSRLYAFASVTQNGVSSSRIRLSVDADDADHLRVTRTGDTWRFEASGDGESWSVLGSFTYDLALTAAGVFAGSSDDDLAGPGYVARVDYFEVAGDPIVDEDASVGGDPAPTANDDAFTTAADTALVLTVASDLLGNDTDDDPLTVTGYGTPQFGTLTPSADGSTVTYTPNPGHSGADSFSYTVSDGSHSDTATVTVTTQGSGGTGPGIDVWYGPQQTFGQRGEAQVWINLLGRVEMAGLVALEYAHNGGAFTELAVGPDTRRLHDSGDFNIDVLFDDLDGTSADDVFTIRATYSDGSVETEDVVVDYVAGKLLGSQLRNRLGQRRYARQRRPGDGRSLDAYRQRPAPVDAGYDRLVAMGDAGWDNYEATLSFTGHDLSSVNPRGRDGGGFGFNMLWNGHTDNPVAGWDPKAGWEGVGSFWYEDGQWFIERYNGSSALELGKLFAVRGDELQRQDRGGAGRCVRPRLQAQGLGSGHGGTGELAGRGRRVVRCPGERFVPVECPLLRRDLRRYHGHRDRGKRYRARNRRQRQDGARRSLGRQSG